MTNNEWLLSQEAIERSKKQYAHFDWRTDIGKKCKYIANPNNIAKHSFYPFIHYEKQTIKYNKKTGKKLKTRDICYAAHIDRCIYQYYSFILNTHYNKRVLQDNISSSAVAYRTDLHENNIHFSKQAFNFIKSHSPVYVMIGDFTGFFDNLDHAYLKRQWCSLLNVDRLPNDHFAVFKSVTSYSKWELSDILQINGIEDNNSGRKQLNGQARVLTHDEYKGNRSHIQKHTEPFGIPQGSPISGILANIYMLDVDKQIHSIVQELGGMYIRYSDDFMVIIPENPDDTSKEELRNIIQVIKQTPRLELEPSKTQYFHFNNGILVNCGKDFHEDADNSSHTISFLGFSFDGTTVRIRSKTISKYYYRMYRKAHGIVKYGGVTQSGKRISGKKLYKAYSQKGSNEKPGNFFSYVNRATAEYGDEEDIDRDTRRHMQKIRKALRCECQEKKRTGVLRTK